MYPRETVDQIVAQHRQGQSIRSLHLEYGVNRSTISEWVKPPKKRRYKPLTAGKKKKSTEDFIQGAFENPSEYAYVLGAYLGDGYICKHPRCHRLRIFCNRREEGVKHDIRHALSVLLPYNKISLVPSKTEQCDAISCYSQSLVTLFPQHGPGMKHTRPIILEPWQEEIVNSHSEQFAKGLIHSEGYRWSKPRKTMPTDYVWYGFVNRSLDIIRLFEEALNRLKIRYKTRLQKRPIWVVWIMGEETKRLDKFVTHKQVPRAYYSIVGGTPKNKEAAIYKVKNVKELAN